MDPALSVPAAAEVVVVVEKRLRLQPKSLQLKLTRVDISHLTLPRQFLSIRDSHRGSNCTTAASLATSINAINLCPEESEEKRTNSACLEALTSPLAVNGSSSHKTGKPLADGVGRGRGRGRGRRWGGVRIDDGKEKKIQKLKSLKRRQNSSLAATKLLSTCVASSAAETLTEKPIETPHFLITTKSEVNVTSSNALLATYRLLHKSTNQLADQSTHHSAYESTHQSEQMSTQLVLGHTDSNRPSAPHGHPSRLKQAGQSPQPGTTDYSSHLPGSNSLCQSSHPNEQAHSNSPSLSPDYPVEEILQKGDPQEVVDKLTGPQEVSPTISSLSPTVSGRQCVKRRRTASFKAVLAMDSADFFNANKGGRGERKVGGAGASPLKSPSPRCDGDSFRGRKRRRKMSRTMFSPPAKRRKIHNEVMVYNSNRLSHTLKSVFLATC